MAVSKKNADKIKIEKMLNAAVENYLLFVNREDYPDKPCVRREVAARQSAVFNLADYLYHYGFITFEQCCEYWAKVGIVDDEAKCNFKDCGGNIDGFCKYIKISTVSTDFSTGGTAANENQD